MEKHEGVVNDKITVENVSVAQKRDGAKSMCLNNFVKETASVWRKLGRG